MAVVIVGMAMPGIVTAPAPTKVAVEPSSVTRLFPGDAFSVDLKITDVAGINAWQAKVSFDPYMLNVSSVIEGPFMKDNYPTFFLYSVGPLGDYVIVGCTFKKAYEVSGSGLLATVEFLCIGAGSTKLALEAKLLDVYGYTIDCATSDGQVTQKAVAEVTGRWEEYQRCPSDTTNTLYAKVANMISPDSPSPIYEVYVYVVFDGLAMDGTPISLESPKATIGRGEEVVLSASFDTATYGVGTYEFTARAYFSYDDITWYMGAKAKTLSFVVIQA